ncbi:hypothetical protein [Ligilactobacillus salivarius]|uniref:hypothetical protein n=1 Tax=Ligilactobacillus salivarius TaxID=1624 RepID=UPI001CDAA8CD|nr:hypothetical protein [Ligilactobacillus salivarius]
MGGRGAVSGISDKGRKYGTEYHSVLVKDNIKFVKYNLSKSTTPPMETMTKGRIYVTVNTEGILKSITFHDKENKRNKQIDLDHAHKINGRWENLMFIMDIFIMNMEMDCQLKLTSN